MSKPLRVLLVEDQVMAADTLKSLSEFEILEVVDKSDQFMEVFQRTNDVDLILMDLMLDTRIFGDGPFRFSGLELIKEARKSNPSVRIVVLSQFEYEAVIVESYRFGASAYLNKNVPLKILIETARRVANGERIAPIDADGLTSSRLKIICDSRFVELSDRDKEFLMVFYENEELEDMLRILKISRGAFNNQMSKINRSTDFKSREELKIYLFSLMVDK